MPTADASSSSGRRKARPKQASAGYVKLDSGTHKLAEIVAFRIEQEIIKRNWPEGEFLGSEPDLLKKYGVSRAVMREAIRLLETHDVAVMRRGPVVPAGGLRVKKPDASAAVRPVALYLESKHVHPRQLQEVRVPLELAVIDAATKRLTEEDVVRLRAALDAEEQLTDHVGTSIHDIHLILADIAGNPALSLFIEVLTKLSHEPGVSQLLEPGGQAPASPDTITEIRRAHRLIVEAVIAGDVALASRRMLKHLNSLTEYIH